jgi:hypothetical protein
MSECKSTKNRETDTPMFIADQFAVAKLGNQPRYPSTDEWIKKIYIATINYFSAIKKNESLSFAGKCMELGLTLSEIGQTQKDKYHIFSLICENK